MTRLPIATETLGLIALLLYLSVSENAHSQPVLTQIVCPSEFWIQAWKDEDMKVCYHREIIRNKVRPNSPRVHMRYVYSKGASQSGMTEFRCSAKEYRLLYGIRYDSAGEVVDAFGPQEWRKMASWMPTLPVFEVACKREE